MLKGIVSFFLIIIFFTFVSCATSPEEIQEEDFSESAILEEPVEEPVADARLSPPDVTVTPDAVLQAPEVLPLAKDIKGIATHDAAVPAASLPLQTPFIKDSPDYVLAPEDVIQVLVWKDDALTRIVMIRPDGKISLPLVGERQAAGLTPGALAVEVKNSLRKYYKDEPEVSVIVNEVNGFSIFILGEVEKPGKYNLRRETTFLQALSLAGGFKEYADTKHILLLRKEGSVEKRIRINYKNLISGKVPEDNLLLIAGDTLIIP